MMDRKKADQQASPKKTPLVDACSHSQRLIARSEDYHSCTTFLDGTGLQPCGTQPEKE